jgi:hypothetical protein
MSGGFDYRVPDTWPVVDEAETRQQVRDTIDRYAPGGQYAFSGGVLTQAGDPLGMQINGWIFDEAWNYGYDYYLKH